ncbi:DUF3726 domain-containing protein [Mesorhizobium sp. 131-2-1]|uniref:DUF3726 domain-containing protein n=1 Tax=Mesorhizobium sp. 131-2-1 TaxID=2744518 RepID=UPI0018EBCBD6|nr:hypothetical protein MesoLj131a_66830 [Mesorhizobium sp. 131-2-1]
MMPGPVSAAQDPPDGQAPLRRPETVLRLERMGSFHQTRLSFMRVLLRRLAREGWQFATVLFDIDARGKGVAIYEARGNGRVYSLVAFGHDLDPAKRTDRVIAEEWDATFALHDGVVSRADIERLSRNVPKQEAGRCTCAELVLARANRSVRLFDHVVATLADGRQPAAQDLDAVGYLMRTTAVYGSGKFGLADREKIATRPEFSGPFAAEMLTVWLIRAFTIDLVEHMAKLKSPKTAIAFDRALCRRLGVGNSTGLGMAPFVVNHPSLFHRWIHARETALARVRSVKHASAEAIATFRDRLARGMRQVAAWRVDDLIQGARIAGLARDLSSLADHIEKLDLAASFGWDRLVRFAAEQLGTEAQEFLLTLLLEPYGDLVDDLAETMGGEEANDLRIDGAATVGSLRNELERFYRHALDTDFERPDAQARFWYVSEEKLEPRLGERASEDGAEREQPLAVARDVSRLHRALRAEAADTSVAAFLSAHPEHRHVVRRVQLTARRPYAEIRDNLISARMRPIDILRCKLSFFGATDFDPRSDRWVRISMFKHAPFPDELHAMAPDDWAIPPLEHSNNALPQMSVQSWTPARGTDQPAGSSLNEIEAQVKKAARGAGLPWGLAEEAGRGGRALAGASPRHLEALADALEALKAGRHSWRFDASGTSLHALDDKPLSALAVAPAVSDRSRGMEAGAMLSIDAPVAAACLLAPTLADISRRSGRRVLVSLAGRQISIGPDIAKAATALEQVPGDTRKQTVAEISLSSEPASDSAAAACDHQGIHIPQGLWQRFGALAALTYVPASEISRLAGAGAGLSDND